MKLPGFIRENVSLRKLTTFGIGGPARWLAEPGDFFELRQALAYAGETGAKVKILGGGSNLLAADSGVDAMVIRMSRHGEFGQLSQAADNPLAWRCGSAVLLASLIGETSGRGVAGLETLAGIPGSVGGAARMNCGSGDGCIGDVIAKAAVCDFSGNRLELGASELAFSYRQSGLGKFIAVAFELRFPKLESPESIARRLTKCRTRKKASQPLNLASAGCFFKNPADRPAAGALIDSAGCKGMSVGDAEVSTLHGNFIVNRGSATCADVVALAGRVRKAVSECHGVRLAPEVAMWGNESEFAGLREENRHVAD